MIDAATYSPMKSNRQNMLRSVEVTDLASPISSNNLMCHRHGRTRSSAKAPIGRLMKTEWMQSSGDDDVSNLVWVDKSRAIQLTSPAPADGVCKIP